ncbi:ras-related protein Rab-43 isoform X2 [Frieseomelitta varia]|uniref:ras-related protein Rab-43 isoform X2 n=1 Tax=Frieseomelitta varia TaxID=561572 RepID=UPI001CB6A810|nr:ras-related protein Rab-43 isoform X2 [Frieseomelitta varia]
MSYSDREEMSNRDPDNLISTNDETFDYLFKIVLIGDCGTGKTCVVQRFRSGTFIERHGNTIGVDFSMKTVLIDDKKVKLQIWDTAGQERFRTITQSYYRSANGVVVVYDITKKSTFLSLQHWVEEVRRYTSSHVLLILVESLREVEKGEAEALCQYLPEVLQVVETSAKENTNIDSVFFYLASELKRRHENRQINANGDEVVRLGASRKLSSCSSCSYKIF